MPKGKNNECASYNSFFLSIKRRTKNNSSILKIARMWVALNAIIYCWYDGIVAWFIVTAHCWDTVGYLEHTIRYITITYYIINFFFCCSPWFFLYTFFIASHHFFPLLSFDEAKSTIDFSDAWTHYAWCFQKIYCFCELAACMCLRFFDQHLC